MIKVPAGPTAYFDVDDTLVMWDLPEDIKINDDRLVTVICRGHSNRVLPNPYNINLLKKMKKRGHAIIIWSAGGSDWAESVIKALDLEDLVDVVATKPTYYIDDIKDPAHILGKHGYFNINGERMKDDHLNHRQDFEDTDEA